MLIPDRPPQWLLASSRANPSGQLQQQPFAMTRSSNTASHHAVHTNNPSDD
jgi:hypothetical protein